jgi:hypothetical protein
MSRITTFVAIGIVIVVAVYMRRFAIDVIGPGTPLYELAAASTIGDTGGEAWAQDIYEAATVWVPWLLVGAALLGGLYREFVRANVTQVRR